MATNGQLLERFLNGDILLPSERQQLVNAVGEWDLSRQELQGIISGQRALETPMIFDPNWRTSPLHTFHSYMTTDATISNNTWTALTFDTGAGDRVVFDFYRNNKSKLRIDKAQYSVTMDGIIDWAPNSSGDRVLRLVIYDANDVSLGSKELSNVPPPGSATFGLKQVFSYTEGIRELFPNVVYARFEVFHNAGGTLNVENAVLSLRVA